ncbi:MAG: hypothetical protein KC503_30410 [Myxococcales bacterium]|nr:hypothetical protein [Myxococcales bacterium]
MSRSLDRTRCVPCAARPPRWLAARWLASVAAIACALCAAPAAALPAARATATIGAAKAGARAVYGETRGTSRLLEAKRSFDDAQGAHARDMREPTASAPMPCVERRVALRANDAIRRARARRRICRGPPA